MRASREQWKYTDGTKVWVGRYRNSHNMPHWHYDCELLLVERGELELICDRERYVLRAGQSAFIDSEQVHHMHALQPDTVLTMAIFDYDLVRRISQNKTPACPVLSGEYALLPFFGDLFAELRARQPFYQSRTEAMVTEKFIEILRGEQTTERETGAPTTETFKHLLDEIDEKYEFFSLSEAATFMSMNPAYFSSLFHRLAGMTFSQYLNYMKTSNAVEMLQSGKDLSIAEISTRCGFSTIRNFNRIFKEITGYTPTTLPRGYVLPERIVRADEAGSDPTLTECVLLASSDGPAVAL